MKPFHVDRRCVEPSANQIEASFQARAFMAEGKGKTQLGQKKSLGIRGPRALSYFLHSF